MKRLIKVLATLLLVMIAAVVIIPLVVLAALFIWLKVTEEVDEEALELLADETVIINHQDVRGERGGVASFRLLFCVVCSGCAVHYVVPRVKSAVAAGSFYLEEAGMRKVNWHWRSLGRRKIVCPPWRRKISNARWIPKYEPVLKIRFRQSSSSAIMGISIEPSIVKSISAYFWLPICRVAARRFTWPPRPRISSQNSKARSNIRVRSFGCVSTAGRVSVPAAVSWS
jgi:hypothetical protein